MKHNFIVDGNWYEPLHVIQDMRNVVLADHYDTTSSAGDWSGYIVVKRYSKYNVYLFSQENRAFSHRGFEVWIDESPTFQFSTRPTEDDILEAIQEMQNYSYLQ